MKRNRLLFILTILIVIIGVLFIVNRKYTTLDDAESGFAIDDTASVTKIFMVDKNNRNVPLHIPPPFTNTTHREGFKAQSLREWLGTSFIIMPNCLG